LIAGQTIYLHPDGWTEEWTNRGKLICPRLFATGASKEESFLEIFKYWILSYLQVHVFTILLKVFKGDRILIFSK
jgi:hypothetical protein